MLDVSKEHHRMKLLTKAIEAKLPGRCEQDGKGDEAIVYVKFFYPAGAATWYITEYDPEDRTFFGLCDLYGDGGELGYVSLDELESFKGRMGLGIERDLHWTPCTLGEVRAKKAS
jgi:hypothetical protein